MGKVYVDRKAKLAHKMRRLVPTYALMVLTFALCLLATGASIGTTTPDTANAGTANADATETTVISYDNENKPTLKAQESATLKIAGSGEIDSSITTTLYNYANSPTSDGDTTDGGYVFSNGNSETTYPMTAKVTKVSYSPSTSEGCGSKINLTYSDDMNSVEENTSNVISINSGDSQSITLATYIESNSVDNVESILNQQIGTISYTYSYNIDYPPSDYRASLKITNTDSTQRHSKGETLQVNDAIYDFPNDAELSYQWKIYDETSGGYINLDNANESSYTINDNSLENSYIECEVSDASGKYLWKVQVEEEVAFAVYCKDNQTLYFDKARQ